MTEHYLSFTDVPTLNNAGKLPLFLSMTCLDGYFINPIPPSGGRPALAETLVRAFPQGAVASFSPTGMGTTYGHDVLNRALFHALFEDYNVQLGPASTWAKLELHAQTSAYADLIETFTLFGDPATALQVLRPEVKIKKAAQFTLPLAEGSPVTFTLVYSNAGDRIATQVVISDVLDSALLNPLAISSGAIITQHVGAPFIWDVADLAPGLGGTITITAQINQPLEGFLNNTAWISAFGQDPDQPSESASAGVGQLFLPFAIR